MGLEFKDLGIKIRNKTLILKDIIDTALTINVALSEKLVKNPELRNHVIQGYIAWLIIYDYLAKNQHQLESSILDFFNGHS